MKFMMRKAIKPMRKLAGWVLVISLLVFNSSGMVLCVGDDGHIAVEPVHNEHSDHPADETAQTHHGGDHSTPFPVENDSGGCVDVSLDLDKASQITKDLKLGHLLKDAFSKDLAASYMVGLYVDGQRTQILANKAPPGLSQSLLAQQTIVLRL